jgi:hypothetical protein
MRLSDAIALGRTLIVPTCGGPNPDINSGSGCVLQMALCAIGEIHKAYSCQGPNISFCADIFGGHVYAVMSRFDYRARLDGSAFDLDAFIDWVRSVEPSDEMAITEVDIEDDARSLKVSG